jgi:hypothetical protein
LMARRQCLGRKADFQAVVIRFVGSIFRTCNCPAHRRRSAVQKFGDLKNR